MKKERDNIYNVIIHGEKVFYFFVIILEIITYTFSFLVSGLAKKDIFNILEGRSVTMGIYSLRILIALNVGVPLIINCVKQINSGLVAKVETRLKRNIKVNLLVNILERKFGLEETRGYGETISLFRNECEDLVSYLMEYYYQLPRIVLCIAILIIMICINPIFAVISLIPTFGMILFIKYLEKHIVTNREEARKSTSNITEYLENLFENIEYFKMAVDTDKLSEIFDKKCKKRARNEIKDRALDKVLSVCSENSAGLVMGIVLLAAIPLYRRGAFSVGEFVMFEYYYAFLASLPDTVGKLIRGHKQSKVSIKRLHQIQYGAYKGHAKFEQGKLEVEMAFLQKKHILKVKKGEVILIRGESESERSILLQRLFQICLDYLPEISCKYIPRQPVLFNASIVDNICFGEPYLKDKMTKVIEQTDLIVDIKEFGDGIHKTVGKQGTMVSGGQRKRISIARVLYSGVDILFIDGLAEAVDKRTEKILISNILEQTESIIFVSSNSESVMDKANQTIKC